jgi:hypothetical protein
MAFAETLVTMMLNIVMASPVLLVVVLITWPPPPPPALLELCVVAAKMPGELEPDPIVADGW